MVSGFKDLWEDIKRKKSDKEENTKKTLVLKGDKFVKTDWLNLRVGQIIKVQTLGRIENIIG